MRKLLKAWWRGEFIPYQNDPTSGVIFIGGIRRRHWTSKVARSLFSFYLREWKWIWPFLVGAIGLGIAIAKLKT